MPWMWVSARIPRLLGGRVTPAIRAMGKLLLLHSARWQSAPSQSVLISNAKNGPRCARKRFAVRSGCRNVRATKVSRTESQANCGEGGWILPVAQPWGGGPPKAVEGPHPCAIAPRSEEHTSELQSLIRISYAVFCLKKKQYINQ